MFKRGVDRGSGHQLASQLTLRDNLLTGLSFSSGVLEAICFLSFGKVFTSFQTGNIVFLGLIAAGTRPPQGPDPGTVIISLAAFAAGAASAMPILKRFDGDLEVDDSEIDDVWPRNTTVALGFSLALQLCFVGLWMEGASFSHVTWVLVAISAFAMGIQMNAVRLLHVPGISTTAVTATFISLVSGIATRSLPAPAIRRLAGVLLATALGALVAAWLLSHAHVAAPLPGAVVSATVFAIASVTLRPRPRLVP